MGKLSGRKPYPLKDFYHRNGITGVEITKALKISTEGHLGNEMNGADPMPAWIDRKLRATALHMNKDLYNTLSPLSKYEKEYCEKGVEL